MCLIAEKGHPVPGKDAPILDGLCCRRRWLKDFPTTEVYDWIELAYPGGRYMEVYTESRERLRNGWITVAENLVPEVPLTSTIGMAFAAQVGGETPCLILDTVLSIWISTYLVLAFCPVYLKSRLT